MITREKALKIAEDTQGRIEDFVESYIEESIRYEARKGNKSLKLDADTKETMEEWNLSWEEIASYLRQNGFQISITRSYSTTFSSPFSTSVSSSSSDIIRWD